MSWKYLVHRWAPSFLWQEARRILAKVLRRLRRPPARVVTLEPAGEARGRVLFSYILEPFLLAPGVEMPRWHTNYWESWAMARTFVEAGYRVDCISWTDAAFQPTASYDVLVDVRLNLERLAPLVGPRAVKVFHIDTAHHQFHNTAQEARHERLRQERGLELPAEKRMPENRGIEVCDCATILGNAFTAGTYAFAGKPLHRVPLSNSRLEAWPEGKDFSAVRRRFLWLGSGGLVHKGLDLVLEAFAGLPDFELVVCGPVRRERAFEKAFFRELYQTPNIHTEGWVDVEGERFRALTRSCLGIVYPSCSEGGGGSVISSMHFGLIPVVTREASVDVTSARGVVLEEATVAAIQRAVKELAARPAAELEALAREAWTFVRGHHSREVFRSEYARFVQRLVAGTWASPGEQTA
jgi:glycosyltransferase involved in cell wall biosynthesis